MQKSVTEPTTSSKQLLPRGVLRFSYSLNCGACGMTSNHMPDPQIKSWEDLLLSVSGGLSSWKLTDKFGWVCGCQEFKERRQERERATPRRRASDQQDDDVTF